MNLSYTHLGEWPTLAWLATCRRDMATVEVTHGSGVETHPDWFAEAVWDGDYRDGDFDQTDLVFGSGGRARSGGLTFVSSGTTVDRLHSLEVNGCVWVSNSLACLLAGTQASVSPSYRHYFEDFETIIHGFANYRREIATNVGPVRLTYHANLLWQDGRVVEKPKPYPKRDFSTFALYRDFLEASLDRLAQNMRSHERTHPYEMLATVSSGYDSPAVAAVARRAGLRQTLSFSRARDTRPDSGAEIARRLGLEPIVVDSSAWRAVPFAEVPFLASDSKGEDVYYRGAKEVLRGRVLLTGYGGSRVWDKGKPPPEYFERSDQSGLSLCEYRLWAGFLHCPVTFLGGRQTAELRRISNSPDMAEWDVPGNYSRPICRRILEEAGVPRGLFGVDKKAASILFFDRNSFLSPESLADYRRWLERTRGEGFSRAARWAVGLPSAAARLAVRSGQALARAGSRVVPGRFLARIGTSGRLAQFANYEPLFDHVFPWAMERATQRYATSRPTQDEAPTRREPSEVSVP
jgi:hypothetical protein